MGLTWKGPHGRQVLRTLRLWPSPARSKPRPSCEPGQPQWPSTHTCDRVTCGYCFRPGLRRRSCWQYDAGRRVLQLLSSRPIVRCRFPSRWNQSSTRTSLRTLSQRVSWTWRSISLPRCPKSRPNSCISGFVTSSGLLSDEAALEELTNVVQFRLVPDLQVGAGTEAQKLLRRCCEPDPSPQDPLLVGAFPFLRVGARP